MKDIIIRVERILREDSKPIDERQLQAIAIVLRGLRNIIRLNAIDRVFAPIRFFRPAIRQTGVMYAVPNPTARHFDIKYIAYPENVPDMAREAFEWVQKNHHPRYLNEAEFSRLRKLAKGRDQHGWKERYLNFPNRSEYISVCGWIFEKQETLISRDASQCLAFDNSLTDELKKNDFGNDEIEWLDVKSFIGCPVMSINGMPGGVLLVLNNLTNGVSAEDLEVVIIASQILSRITVSKEV